MGWCRSIYAAFAAVWGARTQVIGWRWHLGLLGVLAATLLLGSAAGGVLWTFHDMQAGYFPAWGRRMVMFENGAITGVMIGWLIIGFSFPFNVLTTSVAYVGTYVLLRRHSQG